MSGHSHWAGIKHKKGIADQKRGQVFSKLLSAITAAARTEQNPEFNPPHKKVMWGINPRLRTAIQKAKQANVPSENIERAIKRAKESGGAVEELTLEAYGPAGTAILIEAITDNKNRTIPEIKKILSEQEAKWAEPGSVQWAFRKTNAGWEAQEHSKIMTSEEDQRKLQILFDALKEQEDVEEIYANIQ